MAEVVDGVHDIIFGVVAVLHGDDFVEVAVYVLWCSPAMEGNWMKLLSDLSDKKSLIENVINILKSVFGCENHTCHVNDLFSVGDVIIGNKIFASDDLIIFQELSAV